MPQAGLLELVAHGIQDIFLIGNPQITFFKTVFKRHTNFSMQAFLSPLDGTINFGNRVTGKISRYADLVHTMLLEVNLPQLTAIATFDPAPAYGPPGNVANYASGTGNISWVNNTGFSLVNYYDLKIADNLIDRQYSEWMNMWTLLEQDESKKRGLDQMLNRNPELVTNAGPLKLYIPLQFWFCRNIGLSLPLIALQYHDTFLEMHLKPLNQLYTFGAFAYYTVLSGTAGTNIVEIIKPTATSGDIDTTIRAKIMVFPDGAEYFICPDNFMTGNGSVGNPYLVSLTQNLTSNYSNASIYIRPNGVLDISGGAPTILDMKWYIDYIYLDTIEQKEFAKAKHRYLIEQLQYSGQQSISPPTSNYRFALNFNLPVKELFWVIQLDSVALTNDYFNYSNTMDLTQVKGDTLHNALFYINGIERFSVREAKYFSLIQPYQKHTRCPNDFFYSYAFSIKPEEHQPSGCSNFSKIDSKEIYVTLNPINTTVGLRVYALSYNILRIYSGMGGIAFSN
uniref:Major capsid protein N-terminal domain-containing protein n=1 Tax=viral metagenome TaxID=1070528 RepID=A0A6C0HM92_9ZZZZ